MSDVFLSKSALEKLSYNRIAGEISSSSVTVSLWLIVVVCAPEHALHAACSIVQQLLAVESLFRLAAVICRRHSAQKQI
jgi:hypothetical protein